MEKLIEIGGCIEVPPETNKDDVVNEFIRWVESKGWYFGGGFAEIIDDYYVNDKEERVKHILDE